MPLQGLTATWPTCPGWEAAPTAHPLARGDLRVLGDRGVELGEHLVRNLLLVDYSRVIDALDQSGVVGVHVAMELCLPLLDLVYWHVIQLAFSGDVDDHDLVLDRHRRVLLLLQDLLHALA